MSAKVQNFEMARAVAFWRAHNWYWGFIILALLFTDANFLSNLTLEGSGGLWGAARYLFPGFAVFFFIRIIWTTIDPRLITLTDDDIRFPSTNLIFRTVPWSNVQSIEIGERRRFSFVHLIKSNGGTKSIPIPLHLLGIVICERFINALKNYPIEVHCVGDSKNSRN